MSEKISRHSRKHRHREKLSLRTSLFGRVVIPRQNLLGKINRREPVSIRTI